MSAETIIVRDERTGTTIDMTGLERLLAGSHLMLVTKRDLTHGRVQHDYFTSRKVTHPDDDPCVAEIHGTERMVGLIDAEEFRASERVEGVARLLRRVLPDDALRPILSSADTGV